MLIILFIFLPDPWGINHRNEAVGLTKSNGYNNFCDVNLRHKSTRGF